jgi:hypothetical protein
MLKNRKPPSADAILRWIPACAGMTQGLCVCDYIRADNFGNAPCLCESRSGQMRFIAIENFAYTSNAASICEMIEKRI